MGTATGAVDESMCFLLHALILILTWHSAVSSVQIGLDEIPAVCVTGVETCGSKSTRALNYTTYGYAASKCLCDEECNLFGECCIDKALGRSTDVSSGVDENNSTRKIDTSVLRGNVNEVTEVLGVSRDLWGCQDLLVPTSPDLPVKSVRMVVRCPVRTNSDLSEKCEALNRSSQNYHYTMDIPVHSLSTHIWYQNVYCAICNGDAFSLSRLIYSFECETNFTLQEVLKDGKYSSEPLHWKIGNKQCRLTAELEPNSSPGYIRPCGKTGGNNKSLILVEDCPPQWLDKSVAKKCRAYTYYIRKKNDTLLSAQSSDNDSLKSQVYKNPHCAICNGVPLSTTTCWVPSRRDSISGRSRGVAHTPSFVMIMDFIDHKEDEISSCQLPAGVWDVLHNQCIEVVHVMDKIQNISDKPGKMMNNTCPTITLSNSEYEILDNGSLQLTGNTSLYLGHIIDDYEIMQDLSALVCALEYKGKNEDLTYGDFQGYLTEFCLSISVICLILHIATYYALPKLRNLPGKNLLSLSCALLFAQVIFLIGISPSFVVPKGVCIGIALVEYYCFLAAIFWMNVMSIDIWRTFAGSAFRGNGGHKYHKYAGYAWGTSGLIVLTALIVDLTTEKGVLKPSFAAGQKKVLKSSLAAGQTCWFGNGGGLGFFFVLPLSLLLLMNLGLFLNTVYKLWQTKVQGARYIRDKTRAELIQTSSRNSTDVQDSINKRISSAGVKGQKDQVRFYLYLKLFIIMGLTWIFGIIAALTNTNILWYPFIVFNGLQGAFIFVMFDLKRNIGYMLWDKYISRHGYEPPGFLMVSSSSSATRSTESSKSKSRYSASVNDRSSLTTALRNSVSSNARLTATVT